MSVSEFEGLSKVEPEKSLLALRPALEASPGLRLALVGDGRVNWARQKLDLQLVAVSPHRWAQVPVLTELLEGAARELVELQVSGTIDRPEVRARPLRSPTAAVEKLLSVQKTERGR